MSWLLPVKRLVETERVVAFYHPKPAYRVHLLIVPKRAIGGLLEIDEGDELVLLDVMKVAQQLVRELGLEETGYRLVVNGGEYQDVGQLHFHLIGD